MTASPSSPLLMMIALLWAALSSIATPHSQAGPVSEAPARSGVLLISPDSLVDAWQDFAEWKTRLGKPTRTLTLSEISDQYEGEDIQQKIRACCLEHIANHQARWIILGGDSRPQEDEGVPDRDTDHSGFFKYRDLPTDIYYISEKDWDSDQDGIYGEFSDDADAIAYTNARASIGRIPVRTAEDVAAYTAKVIGYESSYPLSGFAQSMIYTCPEGGAYPKLNTSRDQLSGGWSGTIQRFFGARSPWDQQVSGDHDLSPANWVQMINGRKAGKLHMHGHGFLPVWLLENNQAISFEHVARLENDKAYLTMTTVSCFTGHYDSPQDPSITEAMIRAPHSGAVIIIAPSREGIPVFHNPSQDMRLMMTEGKMDGTTETLTLFWQHALTRSENVDPSYLTAGEAFRAAKASMTEHARKTAGYHFVQCELNLLGDPTLDLRATDPKAATLEAPKRIASGRQSLSVTATPESTVCLWKGDEVYAVEKASSAGTASFDISPATPGEVLVSVSGPNLNAATGRIRVDP